jgi:hypothetical protein
MYNIIAIPITIRERHVDFLSKLTIQESGIEIKLLGAESICGDDGQEKA